MSASVFVVDLRIFRILFVILMCITYFVSGSHSISFLHRFMQTLIDSWLHSNKLQIYLGTDILIAQTGILINRK